MTQLPGIAGEIEAQIGLELTVRLLKARGGTDVEIPRRARAGTVLPSIIGIDAAETLIDHFGPGRITLPCAHMRGRGAERLSRKKRALELLRQGQSNQAVALACDLHVRTVSSYRAELEDGEDDQGELPL